MRTKLISFILATALAATAPMAPAQAGSNALSPEQRALALFLGVATLAAIANASQKEKRKERKKKAEPRVTVPVIQDPPHERLPKIYPPRDDTGHRHDRRLSVPSTCARRVQTERGVRTAFGAPCLRRAGVVLAKLPRRCERLADVGQRNVRFWGARCLTNNGVRIQ
ncbi:MAG: hypothetical protein AAGB05_02440 [Pseudomonadota bacterium]